MKTYNKFKMPNAIITNHAINYSTKRVAAVLFCHSTRTGMYRKSLAGLAELSRLSIPTVRKALADLERAGYINRKKCYVYDDVLKRSIYTQTEYSCQITYQGSFTFIPRSLLTKELTPATFAVSLFLYQQMGNDHRAWPSIAKIGSMLDMGIASVCRALATIRNVGIFFVQHCKKVNCSFSHNSYFLLHVAANTETTDSPAASTSAQVTQLQPTRAVRSRLWKSLSLLQHQYNAAKGRVQAFFQQKVLSFFSY